MNEKPSQGAGTPPMLTVEDAAALMAAIVVSSTDAILSTTLDGIITSWNAATERLFGYTASEIVGQHVLVMIPKDKWGQETNILARVAGGERVDNYEAVALTKDGRPVEVSVTISPIRGAGGTVIGTSSIIRDITRRKRAERRAAFLAAIVTSTSDGVISKTIEGIITSWNKGAERIFGFTEPEMLNQSIRRIIPAERQAEEDSILSRILANELVDNLETVRIRKDGSHVEVSITVSPIRDAQGCVIGASKIARDISDRRQTERQLRTLLGELNHRTKNLLSLVQAIARQMARDGQRLELDRFLERLQALSRNQDLLVENDWHFIALKDLARLQLSTFSHLVGRRITIQGPPIDLTPESAQTIGMALHELTTNAAKYGALSNDAGRVRLIWTANANSFSIGWTENGGPPVTKPAETGFGSRVISTMIELSLDGKVEVSYPASGLRWHLTCPLERITPETASIN